MDHQQIHADIWRAEQLLHRLGCAPPFRIQHLHPHDPPDVAVETVDGLIGVELTELNPRGKHRRKHEEEQDQTIEEAWALYDAGGHPPIDVKVFWLEDGNTSTMTRIGRAVRAKVLVEYVVSHLPDDQQPVYLDADEQPDLDLPPGVFRISIVRQPGTRSSWFSPRGAFDVEVTEKDVRPVLERKNQRAPSYYAAFDQIWLLMLTGASGPATWGRITESLRATRFPSPFHRAFVLGLVHREYVELELDHISAAEAPEE